MNFFKNLFRKPEKMISLDVELDGMLYDGTVSGKLADIGKQVREIVL